MRKSRYLSLIAPLILLAPAPSWALDINISVAALDNGLGLANGTDLTAGNVLRIGYFAVDPANSNFTQLSDADITNNKFNFSYLSSRFVQFGTDFYTGQIAGAPDPDYATSQFFHLLTGAPGNFAGKNIFLWAFSSSSVPTSGSLALGVQMGIFKSRGFYPNGADEFSTDGGISLDLQDVPVSNILVGGFGVGTVDAPGSGSPLYNLADLTPTIRFQAGTFSVQEDGNTATITVVRDGNPAGVVSAKISTSGGTATAGSDYTAITAQDVEFLNNETSKTVEITILDDTTFEGNETVNLTLTDPSSGAVLGTQSSAVLTIVENDPNPVGELNFTATTLQGSEAASGQPNTTVNVTVSRTGGQAGAISVDVAVTGGTATVGDDFTLPATPVTLNWADGDTATKSFTVTIISDSTDEGGSETVQLTLQNATNGASLGSSSSTTLTILDSDTTPPTLTLATPAAGAKLSGSTVNVTGTAQDNAAIARVEVVLNSGAPSILTPGSSTNNFPYSLAITPEQGANTLTVTAYDLQNNASTPITRNFTFTNVRPALAGKYNGLILNTAASSAPIDHNGLANITVTSTGTFTGKLSIGGGTVPISGIFLTGGEARFGKTLTPTVQIFKKAKPSSIFLGDLALTLDTAGGNRITGTLSTSAPLTTLANISLDQALYTSKKNPAPPFRNVPTSLLGAADKGKYTALFQSDSSVATEPQGDGWGLLSIAPTGIAKVVGKLADGSSVSYSNALSKNNDWPVFIPLYSKRGYIAGNVNFDPSASQTDAVGNNLRWFKPANPKDKVFPGGWPNGITTDFIASKFIAPKAPTASQPNPPNPDTVLGLGLPGAASTSIANIEVLGQFGGLTSNTSNDASISAKSVVTNIGATSGATALNGLKVSFAAPKGTMSGSFTHPVSSKTVKFGGVVFQKTNSASGYFLFTPTGGATVSGSIIVQEK